MAKRKVHKDKQRSTKHTHKTKDWVTWTSLKTEGELRCSGRVRSSCSKTSHSTGERITSKCRDCTLYDTGSPTSQYRNKQIFSILANHDRLFPDVKAFWLYFEAGHGKNPCDGVGVFVGINCIVLVQLVLNSITASSQNQAWNMVQPLSWWCENPSWWIVALTSIDSDIFKFDHGA